jgi:hypothetical protein
MFLKFGKESHIRDLYENGTIYMSPIDSFRKREDSELRGDSYEGVNQIWNLPSGEFEIPSIGHKGKYISLHLSKSYESILGNIYSLYCISSKGFPSPNEFFIDNKVKGFGSHFLMIKNLPRFMELMEGGIKQTGFNFHHGFVNYYDRTTINGQINLFQKPSEFGYQKEFRFYADSHSMKELKFDIGSLKDISEIHETKDIGELKLASTLS